MRCYINRDLCRLILCPLYSIENGSAGFLPTGKLRPISRENTAVAAGKFPWQLRWKFNCQQYKNEVLEVSKNGLVSKEMFRQRQIAFQADTAATHIHKRLLVQGVPHWLRPSLRQGSVAELAPPVAGTIEASAALPLERDARSARSGGLVRSDELRFCDRAARLQKHLALVRVRWGWRDSEAGVPLDVTRRHLLSRPCSGAPHMRLTRNKVLHGTRFAVPSKLAPGLSRGITVCLSNANINIVVDKHHSMPHWSGQWKLGDHF